MVVVNLEAVLGDILHFERVSGWLDGAGKRSLPCVRALRKTAFFGAFCPSDQASDLLQVKCLSIG
jgi:hypothetical protein